jgi:HSP20 family protein
MNIVRLDPFREMAVLQDRVNRVFGDLGRRFDDDVAARGAWVPAVDVFENDQHELVLKAELPDLKREDIDIRVENNALTLSGQKKAEQEFSEDRYHRIERTFGHFSRTFSLPNTVDTGRISAEYKNGVLTVKLPKRDDAKPKQIQVQVN